MKKSKIYLACILFLCTPLCVKAFEEDSTKALVKLSIRYVVDTERASKNSKISGGEIGSVPASMNLKFDVQPVLWLESPIENLFIISDSRFSLDRTSSEFGLGFRKDLFEVAFSYGFRAIRTNDLKAQRSLSANFESKATKSANIALNLDFFGIETKISSKTSYDGNKKWFYLNEVEVFPFNGFPVHFVFFHESYFGSGTYAVFSSQNKNTSLSLGYLNSDTRSERISNRKKGLIISLNHTWR